MLERQSTTLLGDSEDGEHRDHLVELLVNPIALERLERQLHSEPESQAPFAVDVRPLLASRVATVAEINALLTTVMPDGGSVQTVATATTPFIVRSMRRAEPRQPVVGRRLERDSARRRLRRPHRASGRGRRRSLAERVAHHSDRERARLRGDQRAASDRAYRIAQRRAVVAAFDAALAAKPDPARPSWFRDWVKALSMERSMSGWLEQSSGSPDIHGAGFVSTRLEKSTVNLGPDNVDAICARLFDSDLWLDVVVPDAAVTARFARGCFRLQREAKESAKWRVEKRGEQLVLIQTKTRTTPTEKVLVTGKVEADGSPAFVEAAVRHLTEVVRSRNARAVPVSLVIEGLTAANGALVRHAIEHELAAELVPTDRADTFAVDDAPSVEGMGEQLRGTLRGPANEPVALEVVTSSTPANDLPKRLVVRVK